VSLKDPSLPFVLVHNELSLRPHCFVRIPIRFVPVGRLDGRSRHTASGAKSTVRTFSAFLIAETVMSAGDVNREEGDISHVCSVELVGTVY
jgi:hypothetical protein